MAFINTLSRKLAAKKKPKSSNMITSLSEIEEKFGTNELDKFTMSSSPNSLSPDPVFTVAGFIETCNQILEYSFPSVIVEGEVPSFKINQGKWVFFDLKENEYTIGCFMALNQLNVPVTDGMKVQVRATPKLTRWGKFSLTIQKILPVGEGNIKKSFELLLIQKRSDLYLKILLKSVSFLRLPLLVILIFLKFSITVGVD